MDLKINGMMIFNFIVSVAVFFIGLWFKRLESDHKEMKDEIKMIKKAYQTKELASTQHNSVSNQLDRIFNKLDSIENKLDKKADK